VGSFPDGVTGIIYLLKT